MDASKDELEQLTVMVNQKAAVFMAPMVEKIDQVLGKAYTVEWLAELDAIIDSLPKGDVKAQLENHRSIIAHWGPFLANQRSIIKAHLPKPEGQL